jgi:4-hydroxybenzoate polyprenyltransferase
MLKEFKKIIEVYVYSNLHISIAAGVYILGAYALLDFTEPYAYMIPTMIAVGTFITYNSHRYIGQIRTNDSLAFPRRILFVQRYRMVIGLISTLLLVPIGLCVFWLNPEIWLILTPCVLLTFLYLTPILPGKKRLRDLPRIKIVIIALVWGGLFLLPLFTTSDLSIYESQAILLYIEKFFFFIAITIPFDYRDRAIDNEQGVVTIATQLKSHELKISVVACLAASILSAMSLGLVGTYGLFLTISLCLFYMISIGFCLVGISQRREIYYLGVLDGLILINGLVYFM